MSIEVDLSPCPYCGIEYEVIWNVYWEEPTYCPFCGEDVSVEVEDE